MKIKLHKLFSANTLAALIAGAGVLCAQQASAAQEKTSEIKAIRSKLPKAKPIVKKIVIDNDDVDPSGVEPDVHDSAIDEYDCELGNKLTVYKNAGDDKNIALRWRKHVHGLTRVSTTTGAQRFENAANGLTWITIPAKGLLLNGQKGRQLANECVLRKKIEIKTDATQAPAGPAAMPPEGKAPGGVAAAVVAVGATAAITGPSAAMTKTPAALTKAATMTDRSAAMTKAPVGMTDRSTAMTERSAAMTRTSTATSAAITASSSACEAAACDSGCCDSSCCTSDCCHDGAARSGKPAAAPAP